MSCEDYPCCGHESGCCPDYDESGRQINMRCTCGAVVPLNSRYSLCEDCLHQEDIDWEDDYYEDDSMDGDWDSGMESAGFGTDEDYGYFGGDEY
jgi:hypothetical protein